MKNKILFIIPSLAGGGAEKSLINLLHNLDRSKFSITLCVVEKKGVYLKEIPDDIKTIFLLKHRFLKRTLSFCFKYLRIDLPLRLLARFKLTEKFDVGVSYLDSEFTSILLFLKKKIQKKITFIHSSYKSNNNFNKFIKGDYKKLLIDRYKSMDMILGVSNDVIDDFKELFFDHSNLQVCQNPIDEIEIKIKSLEYSPNLNKDHINLIAVGSLFPVKGYELLIEACKMLKEDELGFRLNILGDGFLKDSLQEQIDKSNLGDHIKLLGFISNPYPYMKESDIFVMSSRSEGYPTVVCEAMILGLPVIVTESSGSKEVVASGEHGVMTKINSKSIYLSLKKMISDEKLRDKYSSKSIERSKEFSIKRAVKKFENLITSF